MHPLSQRKCQSTLRLTVGQLVCLSTRAASSRRDRARADLAAGLSRRRLADGAWRLQPAWLQHSRWRDAALLWHATLKTQLRDPVMTANTKIVRLLPSGHTAAYRLDLCGSLHLLRS